MKHLYTFLKSKDQLIWFEYGFLALVVMMPLLKSGYILTFDMIFTPQLRLPAANDSGYLFSAALHFLNYVLPSQVIQKLLLFLILLLAGAGVHRLVQHLKVRSEWAAYFAGLFYMINPFTYERFMDGHYRLLLGYALLPWFVIALWKFFQQLANAKDKPLLAAIKLAILTAIISVISLHMTGLIALVTLLTTATWLWQHRPQSQALIKFGKYIIITGLIVVAASSYWLWPMLKGHTPSAELIHNFDRRHLVSFRTVGGSNLAVASNVASLQGYWGEGESRFTLIKDAAPWWPVVFGLMALLIITGTVKGWKKYPEAIPILVLVAVIAWVLAIGIAAAPFARVTNWLIAHVPWWAGYREPQKFVALMVLSYAVLGSIGLEQVSLWLKKAKRAKWAQGIVLGSLILPLLYTPTMLWGFNGQLKPVNYPTDWYVINQRLNADPGTFKVLFLPWHQYLNFGFAGRVIANPAPRFFDKPVVAGDNAEIGLIYRQSDNPESAQVESTVLRYGSDIKDTGARLRLLGIKYVILAKDADWTQYGWLSHQADLKLASDSEHLQLFINQTYDKQP